MCRGIYLLPMSFVEIDEARRLAAAAASVTGKREKKRKTATIARLNPEVSVKGRGNDDQDVSDLRTGRWTEEEMMYCDKLTEKFEKGQLPLMNGVKLNDFLAKMLKSKQSRLTKKKKNAKLSTKSFRRSTGYISDTSDARVFSELEDSFFRSISCSMERAEVRFHLQKEWRELFSNYCVHIGQQLEADDWLNSVEEMDRRVSRAKDAARMARRKKIVSIPLQNGALATEPGVFVEGTLPSDPAELALTDPLAPKSKVPRLEEPSTRQTQSPPYLAKIMAYVERHRIPFEHVDAWVPSFVNRQQAGQSNPQKCRLCFAGAATSGVQIPADGRGGIPLSTDDLLDLYAFGSYSEKFSFEVGSGLPGRVYQSGIPSWERSVHHAPSSHFERCGGALQCGVKTVLGLPIPSPNVGRIVVIFYSRFDRIQSQEMVKRLVTELAKVRKPPSVAATAPNVDLIPSSQLKPLPKWKLVVDLGTPPHPKTEVQNNAPPANNTEGRSDNDLNGLFGLIQEQVASGSPNVMSYMNGFTALRLLLLKPTRNAKEHEMVHVLVQSYKSYAATGRDRTNLAILVVRDYLALCNQHQ